MVAAVTVMVAVDTVAAIRLAVKSLRRGGRTDLAVVPRPGRPLQEIVEISLFDPFYEGRPLVATVGNDRTIKML